MTDRETEEAVLHAELQELKNREHEIRDRLLLLAEMVDVPAADYAPGKLVLVSSETCARFGQRGYVTEICAEHMLPVRVEFPDGHVTGFRTYELSRG